MIATGVPTAVADPTTTTPPSRRPAVTTPQVLTLRRLHNFATSTRWVVLHRGPRVLRTMLVVPRVSPGVEVPVMEFAHGWNSNPTVYASMLRAWASAGFLVIAPTSPGMARGRGLLSQGAASARQAADLPAVLSQVLKLKLPVAVNRKRIALAGHSDGGSTVAMLAFNRGYRDRRIDAFLIFSGGRTAINAGAREWRGNTKPVFIADSYADQFGDFPSAGGFYVEARPPKVMVGIGRARDAPAAVDRRDAVQPGALECDGRLCKLVLHGQRRGAAGDAPRPPPAGIRRPSGCLDRQPRAAASPRAAWRAALVVGAAPLLGEASLDRRA